MKKVLLVGNCNYDGPKISSILKDMYSNVDVDDIKTIKEAKEYLERGKYDLVLVNRLIDIDKEDGLHLVDHVVKYHKDTPIIMISNLPDALERAQKHGAKKGFGKQELYGNDLSRIQDILDKHLK